MPRLVPPRKWKTMLKLIAEGQGLTKAAKSIHLSPKAFYDHRKDNPEYEELVQEAITEGVEKMEAEALRRAVLGVEETIYYQGKPVGTVKKYSDVMLIFMLKAANPKKYRDSYQSNAKPVDPVIPTIIVNTKDEAREQWAKFIDDTMQKTGLTRDRVIEDIIAARPDAKQWVM